MAMSTNSTEHSKLLEERANLLQVRRYIDSYTEIFKDYDRNIRTFIQDATDVILPRLEKSGYYKLDQYTVTNYDELKEALFEYSLENDLTDLKRQIGKINGLISECTLKKIYGDSFEINDDDIENIYDLRNTIEERISQIDNDLKAANQPHFDANKDQNAA